MAQVQEPQVGGHPAAGTRAAAAVLPRLPRPPAAPALGLPLPLLLPLPPQPLDDLTHALY